MIDIPNNTDTYGEYLVSAGTCKNDRGAQPDHHNR